MREADCVKRVCCQSRLLARAGPCMLTLQNTAGLRCCVGVCVCVRRSAGRSGSVTVTLLKVVQDSLRRCFPCHASLFCWVTPHRWPSGPFAVAVFLLFVSITAHFLVKKPFVASQRALIPHLHLYQVDDNTSSQVLALSSKSTWFLWPSK